MNWLKYFRQKHIKIEPPKEKPPRPQPTPWTKWMPPKEHWEKLCRLYDCTEIEKTASSELALFNFLREIQPEEFQTVFDFILSTASVIETRIEIYQGVPMIWYLVEKPKTQ